MDLNTLKSWKYFGISAGFHAFIGTLALVGLNLTLSPKSEFSNAIIVDLVAAGEHEKISPMEPEVAGKNNTQTSPPLNKPEKSFAPEPEETGITEPLVEKSDPPPQTGVIHEVEVLEAEEETPGEVLVLAKIPRSALAGLLSGAPPRRKGEEQGLDKTGARASDKNSEEFKHFLSEIRGRLEKAKRYPFLARLRGQEGTTRIRFRISSSGEPGQIQVIESSEYSILDREAVETVKRVPRFPNPPQEEELELIIPMDFYLTAARENR